MKKYFFENFYQPPVKYRAMPFWAWNSKLNKAELARQIAIFREMGFGGFFIHSRVGLDVPYLQQEYFDCVKSCIEAAKKESLDVGIYDEDRWPSGTAGGIVSKNDRFKMKTIYFEKIEKIPADIPKKNYLVLYAVVFNQDGSDIKSYRKIDSIENAELAPNEVLLQAYWTFMKKRTWFNGETYLDTMNKDAVAEFIRVTHETYKKHIGSEFGKSVKSAFNDEMGLSVIEIGCGVPYTENLEVIFSEKYGYDFLDFLPELFYSCDYQVSKTRYDFMNLVTELFVRASAEQLGNWCGENNLQFTGHIFHEDTLTLQYCFNGAAMRFYEFMQCPGVDVLTEHWNAFMTIKQCVSVANQFGKKEIMSELYACTGWDFSLENHKALGDWQFALGINKLVPHIAWYTMRGEAKRDYPASIFFQSPWYKKYHVVSDYFARLKLILEDSSAIRDILVIHPIESIWSSLGRNEAVLTDVSVELHAMEKNFAEISQKLIGEHLDYDYGDEEIISRIGKADAGKFCVGCAEYRTILLPELKTVRESTLKLLGDFVEQGGKVFYLGEVPQYVNALKSDLAGKVYQKFEALTLENYIEKLSKNSRLLSVTDSENHEINPILCRLAKSEDALTLFMVNFGCKFAENIFNEKRVCEREMVFPKVKVELESDFMGDVYEVDSLNGKIYKIKSIYADNKYCFETSFEKLESKLFLITDEKIDTAEKSEILIDDQMKKSQISSWNYSLTEPNVLVLDHAKVKFGEKGVDEKKYILEIDEILRDELNLQYRNDSMVQPYCRQFSDEMLAKKLNFELSYEFDCKKMPAGELRLGIENPEKYQIFLNGKLLPQKIVSWWIDPAITCLELPKNWCVEGKNSLRLFGTYDCRFAGLESLYIQGDFGVEDDQITELLPKLETSDWCNQRLPYYSGNVICRAGLPKNLGKSQVLLSLPDWRGTAMEIKINSTEAINILAHQKTIDITDFLSENDNELQITIFGHRRNGFGPFYLNEKQPFWTDSKAIRTVERETRNLVPCGFLSPIEIFSK